MKLASCLGTAVLTAASLGAAAQSTQPAPRDYKGVQIHVDGIWVTPVPNAPFTATVEIISHDTLPNGSQHVVKTTNHIARNSAGAIRNERRQLVPVTFGGEPRLLSVHLFDPNSRRNVFFDPLTHLARQTVLPTPPRTPAAQLAPELQARIDAARGITVADLGTQRLDGVELHGTRKTRTLPGPASGTGAPIVITDDYWYSPDLHIYLIIRHDDPRSGEQMVAVTHIERAEPPAEELAVPADYKVVDETPPVQPGLSSAYPAAPRPHTGPAQQGIGQEVNLANQVPAPQ